ncbi:hypothetical protein OEZ85_009058 [Tetradesmus obliquus]|uniref:Secreted protein n=1 Tax=Tetradesmus obliquus TaxID=3088 RepID=A0ABY8TL08_TETOB|nr:hypothetical protein OEZ85_009058 [Tetradesmus obliquus]
MKASVAFTAALVILLLASPIQASLPRQQRRRLTASAVAVSSSTARDGASVSSTSQATSTGAPAASVVVAKGSGQGTTINSAPLGTTRAMPRLDCLLTTKAVDPAASIGL